MVRSVRLAIEVGIHYKGWTRNQGGLMIRNIIGFIRSDPCSAVSIRLQKKSPGSSSSPKEWTRPPSIFIEIKSKPT